MVCLCSNTFNDGGDAHAAPHAQGGQGRGFAGALKEIGLPQSDVPLALLTFNIGVEVGQLIFVIVVVAGSKAAANLFVAPLRPARTAVAYLIGTILVVWLVSRTSTFLA